MSEPTSIFLRAHTELDERNDPQSKKKNASKHESIDGPKWPNFALVIDCETTTDERQALTFGFYQFCKADQSGRYLCLEEGIFYADKLTKGEEGHLQRFKKKVNSQLDRPAGELTLLTLKQFLKTVFWRAAGELGALIVGFNLPFDLTRLAADCRKAKRRRDCWSLILFEDIDPLTGNLRENPLRPRLIINPKDSKGAFIRFAGVGMRSRKTGRRLIPYRRGRFLDLRMLGWALHNKSYSLQAVCNAFGVQGKIDHDPTGQVSQGEIEYCRQDVCATVDLLNEMRKDFDKHPLALHPDQAYSPASFAKAYMRAMGVIPPSQKFNLSPRILGVAMQAYYGGRAECRIRHTEVPTVHTDFLSEYTTVNVLMGLSALLVAEKLKIEEATDEVQVLLSKISVDFVSDPLLWKNLKFFALIQPDADILPVRASYDGFSSNIGVNPLSSQTPTWYAGPDLVASTLLTGKLPKILRAIKVVAIGQQAGLQAVSLRGMVTIDPRTDDFFKAVIESRCLVKCDGQVAKIERDSLSYFLKIFASSGSYGLFVEVNSERIDTKPKASNPSWARVDVYSGDKNFSQMSPVIERPGEWYCPLFAALITAAGRLLLALLECEIKNAGGNYLLCDTDSMAIVAAKRRMLVPCPGGAHRLRDGRAAIKALAFEDVKLIAKRIDRLNPYNRNIVKESILKIEDVNYSNGDLREVQGYAISAKRYALFTTNSLGVQIEKASGHGLGFLYAPIRGFDSVADAPTWVVQAWTWVLNQLHNARSQKPLWFGLPAVMRIAITTPEVLKTLQARQMNLSYRDRAKPFNFILSPIIERATCGVPIGADPNAFTLIAPFNSATSTWYQLKYINIHDGKQYALAGC